MISYEEYLRKTLQKVAKHMLQNLLRTEEYSIKFLSRSDTGKVDEEIEKMSIEFTDKFISVLKTRGYVIPGVKAGEKEFQELLNSTLKEYLDKLGTSEDQSN